MNPGASLAGNGEARSGRAELLKGGPYTTALLQITSLYHAALSFGVRSCTFWIIDWQVRDI